MERVGEGWRMWGGLEVVGRREGEEKKTNALSFSFSFSLFSKKEHLASKFSPAAGTAAPEAMTIAAKKAASETEAEATGCFLLMATMPSTIS